jgi:3'-5' exoribonuclease
MVATLDQTLKPAVQGIDRTEQVSSCYSHLNREVMMITDHILRHMCLNVLGDIEFMNALGSSDKHHNFPGGLVVHTSEVMEYAMLMANAQTLEVDRDALRTAIIYHDYCKILDYSMGVDGQIKKEQHRINIGHLAKSYAQFMIEAQNNGFDLWNNDVNSVVNKIGHIMLAHHGRNEWGSPVTPNSTEAMIIHYADMLSSRVSTDYYVRTDDN